MVFLENDNVQFKRNPTKLGFEVSTGLSPSGIENNGRIFILGDGSSRSKIVQVFFLQTQLIIGESA